MHEQSETIQKADGTWVNVYGQALPKAGQQLPDTSTYKTMDEAVAAAKLRSKSFNHQHTQPQGKKMAFENLPDILDKHLNMLNQQSGIDPVADLKRLTTTGPFKDANERHSVWGQRAATNFPDHFAAPIQVAQLDTTQMQRNIKTGAPTGSISQTSQLKESEADLNQLPTLKSTLPLVAPLKTGSNEPYISPVDKSAERAAQAKRFEEEDKARDAAARAAEKLRIKKLMGS
jgi:hypothetical protein